jgi:hypothetical protein
MAALITRPNNSENQQTKATPVIANATTDGTIDEGALVVGFINDGAANASVDGIVIESGTSYTLPYVGKQYKELAVVAAGTTLRISAIY